MIAYELQPVILERAFSPGFRTYPAVHVGSQTLRLYRGSAEDQAWETIQLAAVHPGDVAVTRALDRAYEAYWHELAGPFHVIDLAQSDPGECLTRVLLDAPDALTTIRERMAPDATLVVCFPTPLEVELAEALALPLHGSADISAAYGTKRGVRQLAALAGIPMAPGFVCGSVPEVQEAMWRLGADFPEVIVKHDLSIGGSWSLRWNPRRSDGLLDVLDQLWSGRCADGAGPVVVEGWLKSSAVLGAHVEIVPERPPIICAGWRRMIGDDGKTQIGSEPLRIAPAALASFTDQAERLTRFLQAQGAIGSYGIDALIVADDEANAEPGTIVLLDLNARAPAAAYALEIVKRIRGRVGAGFCTRQLHHLRQTSFDHIAGRLDAADLLVRRPDPAARGVVPYNVGLLPWKTIDLVAMADSWDETAAVMREAIAVLGAA